MESFFIFTQSVFEAPSVVWTIAILMSALSGYIINAYVDNFLHSLMISVGMFFAIMIAVAGFAEMGVYFTANRDANVVAAAGATICGVTLMSVILMRVLFVIGDWRQTARRTRAERA